MTIAACYLSREGVVLGADSTSTTTLIIAGERSVQHLDYAQKIFEIGEHGTLAVVCWGLGGIGDTSFRTMSAELGYHISGNEYTVDDAATWWHDKFWDIYKSSFAAPIEQAKSLRDRRSFLRAKSASEGLTEEENDELASINKELKGLMALGGGFCVGGRGARDRTPRAFEIVYDPLTERADSKAELQPGWSFWGCPNIVQRIIFGIDNQSKRQILESGKWNGTPDELDAVLTPLNLQPYTVLPLREAIDWVHSMLYSIVKAFKFSPLSAMCGGPIDIALISSDRPFRWIRHKSLGAAIVRSDHHLAGEA